MGFKRDSFVIIEEKLYNQETPRATTSLMFICLQLHNRVKMRELDRKEGNIYSSVTGDLNTRTFLAGVSPSPIPEFSNTPQENHMADDKVRASSSSSSLFTLNLPNGLEGKNWEDCRRQNEKWLRSCRKENPGDPRQGRELNMCKQSKERDTIHRTKKDKDSGTGAERWDVWSQSSPLSVFVSTPREDLQCSGTHVHTHTH